MSNEGCKIREIDYVMSRVQKRTKENIEKLMKWNGEIEKSILNGTPLEVNITLDELYRLIPMTEKKVSKYTCLINELFNFNIKININ